MSRGWLKAFPAEWLKTNGFHEIEADVDSSSMLIRDNRSIQEQLDAIREDDAETEMTHSVAINIYPATMNMPQLTIVVIDTIPCRAQALLQGLELVRLCSGR